MSVMTNIPPTMPMHIKRGQDFSQPLQIKTRAGIAKPVTGYQFTCQITKTRISADVIANPDVVITDGPSGRISIVLLGTSSASIVCGESANDPASVYHYELKSVSDTGEKWGVLQGPVFVEA